MLHIWTILLSAFCAGLAAVAALRGVAGLLVGRSIIGRLEAAALLLIGVGGWLGLALTRRFPL